MNILGLNAYHPDSAACLVRDGQLIACAEEERFRRVKHWAGFPREAVRFCLQEGAITAGNIDYIAVNRDPKAKFFEKAAFALLKRPPLAFVKDRLSNLVKIEGIKKTLAKELSISRRRLKTKTCLVEHHRAHLASAFFVSPFEKAAVVSIDGFGDFTSCMLAKGEGSRLKIISSVSFPHSLGIFYTAFTQYLGFRRFGDEYKVMGLSAYGEPKYIGRMRKILILNPNSSFALDPAYFSIHGKGRMMLWDNGEPALEDVFAGKITETFGPPRKKDEELSAYHRDIAASLQKRYEEAFFHVLNYAYKATGLANLCLAGGCALNSLANGKIFDQTPFRSVYIQPGASDAGGALGAAFYLQNQILKAPRAFTMEHAYWGPAFSEEEIEAVLNSRRGELGGCAVSRAGDEDELCRKTALLISDGKIVGWFQGRMEWGQRALGNRSILADPRRSEMKDVLNARIKRREHFRPFAPSILEERTAEYFEEGYPDPFMQKVYPIRKEKRDRIPAVVHVDGTGRLQTVARSQNPLYWKLIREFESLTGIPVLLNTSFNENEPIVCAPSEALDCFVRTRMDALVIGRLMIERK